jgi:hypothetical protein
MLTLFSEFQNNYRAPNEVDSINKKIADIDEFNEMLDKKHNEMKDKLIKILSALEKKTTLDTSSLSEMSIYRPVS